MPHGEIILISNLGKFVPRTDQLTVVTTVDAVADHGPQLFGDRAAQFDSEVGNATPGVDNVRLDDRVGRADIDATASLERTRGSPSVIHLAPTEKSFILNQLQL